MYGQADIHRFTPARLPTVLEGLSCRQAVKSLATASPFSRPIVSNRSQSRLLRNLGASSACTRAANQ